MDKNISPEEKLLRLIRGRPKVEPGKESAAVISAQEKIKIRRNYFKPIEDFLKTCFANILNFKSLNILLSLLLIIFFIFSLVNFLTPVKLRINDISQAVKDSQEQQEIKISQPKNYDYYYKQFSRRDIFNAPLIADKTENAAVSGSLKEATKNLRLVGVILGKQPQAIIEDKVTQMTHFLNKGDTLNQLRVKDILESRVILSIAGEDIELAL